MPSSGHGRSPDNIRTQPSTLSPRAAVCLVRATDMQAALRRARAPAPALAFAPAPAPAEVAQETPTAEAATEAPAVYVTYNVVPAQTEPALAPGVAPFGVGAPEARYGFAPLVAPLAQQVSPGLSLPKCRMLCRSTALHSVLQLLRLAVLSQHRHGCRAKAIHKQGSLRSSS